MMKTAGNLRKKGEWNLHLMRWGTRWGWYLQNPMDGGVGESRKFSSKKKALARGLGARGFKAGDRLWVVTSEWDPKAGHNGDFLAEEAYWLTLTEDT